MYICIFVETLVLTESFNAKAVAKSDQLHVFPSFKKNICLVRKKKV